MSIWNRTDACSIYHEQSIRSKWLHSNEKVAGVGSGHGCSVDVSWRRSVIICKEVVVSWLRVVKVSVIGCQSDTSPTTVGSCH